MFAFGHDGDNDILPDGLAACHQRSDTYAVLHDLEGTLSNGDQSKVSCLFLEALCSGCIQVEHHYFLRPGLLSQVLGHLEKSDSSVKDYPRQSPSRQAQLSGISHDLSYEAAPH